MPGTMNVCLLVGRLGADTETKYTQDATAISRFNLATDFPKKQADGTWGHEADWERIVCFGKLAEIAAEYLKKGSLVGILGRVRSHSWIDAQTGERKYGTEIIANQLTMLGSKPAPEAARADDSTAAEQPTEQSDHPRDAAEANDLPF